MNPLEALYAALLGLVEGLTEFLPISSTGHLIIVSALLNYPPPDVRDTFDIFIQLGAVLAVLVYYSRDLFQQARRLPAERTLQRFWLYVFIAFLPAAAIGFLLRDWIKQTLFKPSVIGVTLIIGGVAFLLIERNQRHTTGKETTDPDAQKLDNVHGISLRQAVLIGLAQVIALIPGVSRSGASILGGMMFGLDRQTATKFSFYLALPTLGGATVYELFSAIRDGVVTGEYLPGFIIATGLAFVLALVSIAWLLRYVATHDFRGFGIYRIIAGSVIIALVLLRVL